MTAAKLDVVQMRNHPYPKLPEWSYGKTGTLYQSNASIRNSPTHAPYSQPFVNGYDIRSSRIGSDRLTALEQTYNASIADGEFQMSIFVLNVSIDTALSGSYGQGRWTRDFYPHNFTQPSFIISGQSQDQGFYGKLCEFVHQAQQKAVFDGSKHLTQLIVRGGEHPRGNHTMTVYDGANSPSDIGVTRGVASSVDGVMPNQTIRGTHKDIVAKGYIKNMPRLHRQGDPAPQWQFTFVVAAMISGPYQDTTQYSLVRGNSWIQLLKDTQANGAISSTSQMVAASAKSLAYATKNSANIFNDPSANTPSGS